MVAVPLFVWVASVLPAELAFRFLGRVPKDTNREVYIPFGRSSYVHGPNRHVVRTWASGTYTVCTDADGLRVQEDDPPALPGDGSSDRTWLLLGDSQGFGNGLNYRETLSGVFSRAMREQGVRVRNLSVGGHFLKNQVEVLHDFVAKQGRPDRVVLLLTPRMIGSPTEYATSHVHESGNLFLMPPTKGMLVRLYLKNYSAVYLTLRDAIKNSLSSPPSVKSRLPFYDTERADDGSYGALEEVVGGLVDWAREQQVQLVWVYLPLALEHAGGISINQDGNLPVGLDMNLPFEFAQRTAGVLGVHLIDTRSVLEEVYQRELPLTLVRDAHYGRELSDACAGFLLGQLSRASGGVSEPRKDDQNEP